MTKSKQLGLNYLFQHQASKDILINDNFDKIDKLLWLVVKDIDIKGIPSGVRDGDAYIIGAVAEGEWKDRQNNIAVYRGTFGWDYYAPHEGMMLYVASSQANYIFNGSKWVRKQEGDIGEGSLPSSLQDLTMVGINTKATGDSRLMVQSPKVAFRNATDVDVEIGKGGDADTSSITLSSNSVAKGVIGLVGSNDLRLNVSANGQDFREGISIQNDSGQLIVQNGCYVHGGLQFAGSDKALMHYDSGSWIPQLKGKVTSGTVEYEYQSGGFVRVGSMIFVHFFIRCRAGIVDGDGDVIIDGLPFQISSATNFSGSAIMSGLKDLPQGSIPSTVGGVTESKHIDLFASSSTGAFNIVIGNIDTNFEIRSNFVYQTQLA